ncbi:MAG: MoaD/ThiS family protein [Candidatus Micrarchaeia archaeon]
MKVLIDGEIVKVSSKKRKNAKVMDLIKELEMSRETVIARVNGKIVTEFDEVHSNDTVEFIRVSTGG